MTWDSILIHMLAGRCVVYYVDDYAELLNKSEAITKYAQSRYDIRLGRRDFKYNRKVVVDGECRGSVTFNIKGNQLLPRQIVDIEFEVLNKA